MAILEKTAPRFLPPKLKYELVALYQARDDEGLQEDGLPARWQALQNRLWAATESGALAFTVPDVPGMPHWKELRTPRVIHRSDYVAWLETIGEPPPIWWRCEGDPLSHAEKVTMSEPSHTIPQRHRHKDVWSEIISAAVQEFALEQGKAGTAHQIWQRLLLGPPEGRHYQVVNHALQTIDKHTLTRSNFMQRFRRLHKHRSTSR